MVCMFREESIFRLYILAGIVINELKIAVFHKLYFRGSVGSAEGGLRRRKRASIKGKNSSEKKTNGKKSGTKGKKSKGKKSGKKKGKKSGTKKKKESKKEKSGSKSSEKSGGSGLEKEVGLTNILIFFLLKNSKVFLISDQNDLPSISKLTYK